MGTLQLLRDDIPKLALFDVFQRYQQERRLGQMAPTMVQRIRELSDQSMKGTADLAKMQGQSAMWKKFALGAGGAGLLLWLLRNKLNGNGDNRNVTINRYGG